MNEWVYINSLILEIVLTLTHGWIFQAIIYTSRPELELFRYLIMWTTKERKIGYELDRIKQSLKKYLNNFFHYILI